MANNDDNPWGWNQDTWKSRWKRGDHSPQAPDPWGWMRRFLNKQPKKSWILAGGVVVVVWLLSGLYVVQTSEKGLVLRFGEYVRTDSEGLNYHLPWPIESHIISNVGEERTTNITGLEPKKNKNESDVANLMLTGDGNIVDLHFAVFWRVGDPVKYQFQTRDPETTLRLYAESAMREIIGRMPLQPILSKDRGMIEIECQNVLQRFLDDLNTGISISHISLTKNDPPETVIAAFNDVQAAEADRERMQNQANSYSNKQIPIAKGRASKIHEGAAAYKVEVIRRAQGEALRFLSVYDAYRVGGEIFKKRMYFETMEDILKRNPKLVLSVDDQQMGGILPYLPLPSFKDTQNKNDSKSDGKPIKNGEGAKP